MRLTLLLIAFVAYLNLSAQITFEKGYFIANDNKKIDCLIKNTGWPNNPISFEFKLTENDSVQTQFIDNITEFGIVDQNKFIRVKTKINQSPTSMKLLTTAREPDWVEQEVFLKVLLESKLSLYKYEANNILQFLIKLDNQPIEPLVYKPYLANNQELGSVVTYNDGYKQQLWNLPKCESISSEIIQKLRYTQGSLIPFVETYNSCLNQSIEVIQKKKDKWFAVKLGVGASFNQLKQTSPLSSPQNNFDFDPSTTLKVGFEFEFIIPSLKNKLSVVSELNYNTYSDSKTNVISASESVTSSVNIAMIEPSLGIRYYSFLSPKTALYFNGVFIPPVSIFTEKEIIYKGFDFSDDQWFGFAIGTGLTFKRFSLECRYYTPRDFTRSYGVSTELKRLQFTALYKLN